jgi:hypothetical protein
MMSTEMLWGAVGTLMLLGLAGVLWWLRKHDAALTELPETYATKRELDRLADSIDANLKELRVDVRTQTQLLQSILTEDRAAHRGVRGPQE